MLFKGPAKKLYQPLEVIQRTGEEIISNFNEVGSSTDFMLFKGLAKKFYQSLKVIHSKDWRRNYINAWKLFKGLAKKLYQTSCIGSKRSVKKCDLSLYKTADLVLHIQSKL